MNRFTRTVGCVVAAGALVASSALAQRQAQHRPSTHGAGSSATAAPAPTSRVITIPVVEAANMMQRQRVYLFTAPAGNSAFGIGTLGEGHRVWALLPSCRPANPDDPRDPCPVGHLAIEVVGGGGEVHANEPQPLGTAPDARRVQSFVVPAGIEQIRIKILRRDEHVRYEAAVDAGQLGNLPVPEGHPRGPDTFAFDLPRYPSL
jgi:hypothetical protein